MSKLIIRITVIGVAIYLILCYLFAIFFNDNLWSQTYYLLFELCVCLCISKQGVYHCKYIKYTAYGILLSDCVVCLDNTYNLIPTNVMSLLPPLIISFGLFTTTMLAIKHYIRVHKIKRQWERKHRS